MSRHYRVLALAAVLTAALAAGGCDDNDDPIIDNSRGEKGDAGSRNNGADGGSQDDDAAVSLDGGSNDGGRNDGGTNSESGDAAAELSDPQIAAVTSTANAGEGAQANAARPKLTQPDAQAFADMMVAMHTAAQTRQATLLMQKGITPQENPVSTQLKQESDAIVAQLSAATAPVDLAYMEAQVMVHQKVLTTLDTVLIPSADDAQLKAELTTSRGEVSAHLSMAQAIRNKLAGDAGS